MALSEATSPRLEELVPTVQRASIRGHVGRPLAYVETKTMRALDVRVGRMRPHGERPHRHSLPGEVKDASHRS